MKQILVTATLFALVAMACNTASNPVNKTNLLHPGNLPSAIYTINTEKDTMLVTANGAVISIAQGTLQQLGKTTVQLEIKEAYSIEQIIKAGLNTRSDGRPLRSGGMIYINAVAGQTVTISKPIHIKIPTPFIDSKMQLFSGEQEKNGNINWVKPDSLPANPQTTDLNYGKSLFANNCAACHGIGKNGTGPDLAHILKKTTNKTLLYDFTRDNLRVMHDGNLYYNCLYNRWGRAVMNRFPALTNKDLDLLYEFIENESAVRGLAVGKDEITPCIDSCLQYYSIKSRLEQLKGKLTREKVAMVVRDGVAQTATIAAGNTIPIDSSFKRNTVVPVYNQSLYYQFNIESFGWSNIDALLYDDNFPECSLMVTLGGQYQQNINTYLVIPSIKLMLNGGALDGKADRYGFYTKDGKIKLPQDTRAFIIAIGESGTQLVFSIKEFTTSTHQDLEMSLHTASMKEFDAAMAGLNIMDLSMTARKTANADTLLSIIKSLEDVEKIKPVQCDCSCFFSGEELAERPVADTTTHLK